MSGTVCSCGVNGSICGSNHRLAFESIDEMYFWMEEHKKEVRFIDCCFTDCLGAMHHCTFSIENVSKTSLREGFGFDGSSIALFEKINNSDLVIRPEPATCWLDPFSKWPTLHVACMIYESRTLEPYRKCPRQILKRTIECVRRAGVAEKILVAPEIEFFVFNSVEYTVGSNHAAFHIDGEEAYWNTSGQKVNNLAHRRNLKEGYMSVKPFDRDYDLRSEMLVCMESLGIPTEKHHHEVATCQMELNIKPQELMQCADSIQIIKYVVKNVAAQHHKSATFMPKPLATDNGSGMHCNISLWRQDQNLFWPENEDALQPQQAQQQPQQQPQPQRRMSSDRRLSSDRRMSSDLNMSAERNRYQSDQLSAAMDGIKDDLFRHEVNALEVSPADPCWDRQARPDDQDPLATNYYAGSPPPPPLAVTDSCSDLRPDLTVTGLHFVAGILKHCSSLLAFVCPTTNSYRRLVPDFEAPIHITYAAGNRSAVIRIPLFANHTTKRIEFRSPDASGCSYLAFAAIMLAGIDGILNNLPCPPPAEGDLFNPNNPLSNVIPKLPVDLHSAINALEDDHQWLLRDGAFTKDFITAYINFKRKEVARTRYHPHPQEFALYYGC